MCTDRQGLACKLQETRASESVFRGFARIFWQPCSATGGEREREREGSGGASESERERAVSEHRQCREVRA